MTHAPTAYPTISSINDDYAVCCLFCPRYQCDMGTYADDYGYDLSEYDPKTGEVYRGLLLKCCGGHCDSVRCPSPEEEL